MSLLPTDAIAKIAANDPSFTKCDLSGSSIFTSRPDEFAIQIADGLKSNTHLEELILSSCGISVAGATAIADALRVNQTLTKLDLEKNLIDSAGIQAIGEMLKDNQGIVEMNLLGQSSGAPGEGALTAFIESFEYNTTLLNIIWRLTSRQSFKINACITRNNEIARRKKIGKSVDDIDPNIRRETAARILAERADGNPPAFTAPVKDEITEKIPARGAPYTLKELSVRNDLLPDDVDIDRKEDFLGDEEFQAVLGMDRTTFASSPVWKRKQKKKDAGLF